jgi:group I intron endonuclease
VEIKSGIYQIVNQVNGKRYIGSAVNLNERKYTHLSLLRNSKHHNKHLQQSYNKNNETNFKFEILLYCDKKDLIFYEQRAINAYSFYRELYNIRKIAESNIGIKFSEEHKMKIGLRNKGRKRSEEEKNKIRNSLLGFKHSIETINKLKSRIIPTETRLKISKSMKGIKRSEESKAKYRDSKIGCKNPMFGRNFSELHRERMSESGKKKSKELLQKLKKNFSGENNPKYIKYTIQELQIMKKMRNDGYSYKHIAQYFGCSPKVIISRLKII